MTKEILQGTPKGAAKKRREATAHALVEHPLAFRLSLMKGDKSAEIRLYLVAAQYKSQRLNEQAVSLDSDDIVKMAAPKMCRYKGAVLRMDPVNEERDAALVKLLGRTLLTSCPPSTSPGVDRISVTDAFKQHLSEMGASFPKRSRRSPSRHRSQRRRSRSRRPVGSK